MPKSSAWPLLVIALFLVVCYGCSPSADVDSSAGSDNPAAGESGVSSAGESAASSAEKKPFKLGDLLEPFTPPTLAELDAKAEWVDMPVLDSMELLRQRQADEKQLVSVSEAIKLRNTSEENNAKILSALGRLPATDGDVDWNAPIARHEPADLRSTNPLMASSVIEFDFSGMTSFGLFSFDWDMRPFAAKDTVVSWQTSKDHMCDKVVMRNDLTWSDGKPITAHDVVFSFKVIMTDAVPVPAMRSGTDRIRWIEAYDDHTLVYFHQEPLATNIWNLNFAVIPKHIYERTITADPTLQQSDEHVRLGNQPVTGGAYELARRALDKEIVLNRRESWYMHGGKQVRDKPYFAEIRFRIIKDNSVALLWLKKGDIEELQLTPDQWVSQTDDNEFYDKNTKAYGIEWTSFHFMWNLKSPFFSDVRVRKAMSYAFDYDELLEKRLYGLFEPCNGIFHPTSPWAPKDAPKPYRQNLDEAERLLDEAGWADSDGDGIRDNGRGQRFEFSLIYPSGSPHGEKASTLMKENLDQIGIICHVRPLEFPVLMEKTLNHDFQAAFGGWGTGADPDTSENIWGTNQGRNYISYSNSKVDELFEKGRKEFDSAERAKYYGEIHKILWEDQPYTWLFTRNAFYGFNKQLRGYNFSPRGPYNYGPGFTSIWKPVRAVP
ncbi:MAG: peptide-binding protein [Planctomycetota bacterium]